MSDLDLTAATDAAARRIMNAEGCYESSSFIDSCGAHAPAGPWVYRPGESGMGWCPGALALARVAVEAAATLIAEQVGAVTYEYRVGYRDDRVARPPSFATLDEARHERDASRNKLIAQAPSWTQTHGRWPPVSERMTDERLAEIEARADAATSQPWGPADGQPRCYLDDESDCGRRSPILERVVYRVSDGDPADAVVHVHESCDVHEIIPSDDGIVAGADIRFIAAAREDVPDLIAEVRRLRAELARYRPVGHIPADYIEQQRPDGPIVAHPGDWEGLGRTVQVYVREPEPGGES